MTELPENPWATRQGRLARAEQFRRLASGEGELAEFAKEVLAGRVEPHALVRSPVLSDEVMRTLHAQVERWHALSDREREEIVAGAEERTRARIEALAEAAESAGSADEPGPPEEDPPAGPVLRDAW
ncbi:hypothetical protein BLA60_03195 [Actinophytocola xinjiangensis]|uniref:Uncharacterized protein n=1 Tax=Actinophytocola xinjiangensis TaxID=485602 RepID=A0A7Z1B1F7_9PSEU|nr:hypothetical protein [Actinophytocola xinjiangensis]OLF14171.1 hypothetical protein BLA60_03195 [Actinophytocola xinjiangensis]